MNTTSCWSSLSLNVSGKPTSAFFSVEVVPLECAFPVGSTDFEATLKAGSFRYNIAPKQAAGSEGYFSLENGVYDHMITQRFH